MSARDLWRRLCAAAGGRWRIPNEADMLRLTQQLVAAREDHARAVRRYVVAEASLAILKAVLAEAEGDVDRLTRERDSWRRQAERVPLTPAEEETARRERLAEVERTGGR